MINDQSIVLENMQCFWRCKNLSQSKAWPRKNLKELNRCFRAELKKLRQPPVLEVILALSAYHRKRGHDGLVILQKRGWSEKRH